MSADAQRGLADLAVQYWKLCQAFERELAFGDERRIASGEATLRFARRRLDTILAEHEMRVATFEGEAWTAALPVIPINPDDITTAAASVDATIEPTILGPACTVAPGKVMLRNA